MDVIMLSRLQFAVAVFFHFIFVPLTLGLSLLIALMETRYVMTGDEAWRKHAKFWGKLFTIPKIRPRNSFSSTSPSAS